MAAAAIAVAAVAAAAKVGGAFVQAKASADEKEASRKEEALNKGAIDRDVELARVQLAQQVRVLRTERAVEAGRIKGAAAASGVTLGGSIADALMVNAAELAGEEFDRRIEAEQKISNLQTERNLVGSQARTRRKQADARTTGAFLSALGGASQSLGAAAGG